MAPFEIRDPAFVIIDRARLAALPALDPRQRAGKLVQRAGMLAKQNGMLPKQNGMLRGHGR